MLGGGCRAAIFVTPALPLGGNPTPERSPFVAITVRFLVCQQFFFFLLLPHSGCFIQKTPSSSSDSFAFIRRQRANPSPASYVGAAEIHYLKKKNSADTFVLFLLCRTRLRDAARGFSASRRIHQRATQAFERKQIKPYLFFSHSAGQPGVSPGIVLGSRCRRNGALRYEG